jgi:hypothetical protein
MNWISVKDEEPEEIRNVLWAVFPLNEPYWFGSMMDEDYCPDYYTHWMSLDFLPQEIPCTCGFQHDEKYN